MSTKDFIYEDYVNDKISKIESHFDPDQQTSVFLQSASCPTDVPQLANGNVKPKMKSNKILDHSLVVESWTNGGKDFDEDNEVGEEIESRCPFLHGFIGTAEDLNPISLLAKTDLSHPATDFESASWDSARLLEHFLMDEDDNADVDANGERGHNVSSPGNQQSEEPQQVVACVTFEGSRDDQSLATEQTCSNDAQIAATSKESFGYDAGMIMNNDRLPSVVSFGATSATSNVNFGSTAADGCFDVEYVNSLRDSPTPFDLPTYRELHKPTTNVSISRPIEHQKLSKSKGTKKRPPSSKPQKSRTLVSTKPVSSQQYLSSISFNAVDETRHQSWTFQEDDLLRDAVKAVCKGGTKPCSKGPTSWDVIGKKFVELGGNRSASQCRTRYPKLVFKQGKWDRSEDDYIKKQVKKLGTGKWATIAKGLPNRRSDTIRDRWVNHLDPRIVKSPMDDLETRLLFQWVSILGNEWSTISALMYVFRTPNQCKNRFNNQTKALQIKRRLSETSSSQQPGLPAKKRKVSKTAKTPIKVEQANNGSAKNDSVVPFPLLVKSHNGGFTSVDGSANEQDITSFDTERVFEL